ARIELARVRVEWRTDVRAALKNRDEELLEELFTSPPEHAIDRLSASERRRSRRLIEQRRALDVLRSAVTTLDDSSIVSALNHVERVGARITDRATWVAIQEVVERASLVEDVIAAAKATPYDVGRLAQLIPAAKAVGLDRDPRLVGEFSIERLESQLLRQAHIRRIRAAIGLDDDAAIVLAAVPDPYGVLAELDEPERDRVAAAIVARRQVDRDAVAARFEQERGHRPAFA
ncbi:MAG TPA: hypothetical protein VFQ54_13100, partial [Thermomicrobiales bacterium]|nr:hypothetical protein [Thermomicrobiales bacterium]